MRREHGVVLADRGSQKRWPPAGDGKLEARQYARVVREQTVIAPLNISEGIRKEESVCILQRESRQQSPTFAGFIRHADTSRCGAVPPYSSGGAASSAICAMFMARRTGVCTSPRGHWI